MPTESFEEAFIDILNANCDPRDKYIELILL